MNYFFSKTIYYYLRNEEKSFYKSQLAYINWLKKRFFFASRRDNLYRSLHITLDTWSELLGYIILFFFFFFAYIIFFLVILAIIEIVLKYFYYFVIVRLFIIEWYISII